MPSYMTDSEKLLASPRAQALSVKCVSADGLAASLGVLSPAQRSFAEATGFKAQAGRLLLLPDASGKPELALLGMGSDPDPMLAGRLPAELPEGTYRLEDAPEPELAAFAFLAGAYRFSRYRKSDAAKVRLVPPRGVDAARLQRLARSVFLARDLINTAAGEMGPAELEAAARVVAKRHGAKIAVTTGEALLKQNFPMIHAVGRASTRAPRLIDMTWGPAKAPKVTLVGKGVCFDTGGLDLKTSAGMLMMKKDMGGAANVLALADMIMDAGLKLRLRVLIPAVENAVSGNAFRPGDVLESRKGISVEIGNTDAEGRLVLADALALGDAESPDLMIDMATLTGAARVAMGPEIPPFFTGDDEFAVSLAGKAASQRDPLWRLPLWKPYMSMLDSKVADINNAGSGGFAGAITAALFLSRFVEKAKVWAHFDIYAWNASTKPGRPEGGEAMAIRALYSLLEDRYPA